MGSPRGLATRFLVCYPAARRQASKEIQALRATYLTGELVYLRAMTKADAANSVAWHHSAFPLAQFAAEKTLEQVHSAASERRQGLYAACRVGSNEVVGSVKTGVWAPIRVHVSIKVEPTIPAPEAGQIGAELLRLVVPWQAGEMERPVVIAFVPAWSAPMVAAAEQLGMERMVRFRQQALHNGERHDMFLFQYVRPDWVGRLARA